jgi:P-type E1-E2 ATPase
MGGMQGSASQYFAARAVRPPSSTRLFQTASSVAATSRGRGFVRLRKALESRATHGQTVMFVAVDGRLAGLIGAADAIKASSEEALRWLHEEGVRVVMATGDSRTTAAAVARKLGLDAFEAEVLPASKVDVVSVSVIGNALRLRKVAL